MPWRLHLAIMQHAEKQYRYPTEYGAQKPPTAQWTVTGAGAALLRRKEKDQE